MNCRLEPTAGGGWRCPVCGKPLRTAVPIARPCSGPPENATKRRPRPKEKAVVVAWWMAAVEELHQPEHRPIEEIMRILEAATPWLPACNDSRVAYLQDLLQPDRWRPEWGERPVAAAAEPNEPGTQESSNG